MTGWRPARIFDMHSHWGTRRGYPFQTPEELAQQERVFRSKPSYVSEVDMAEHFRATGVRAILDLGVRAPAPIDEIRALHDSAFDTQKQHADVIAGHWLHIDPRLDVRSEEHTSELQSQSNLVCRLLLEKKKAQIDTATS